MHRLTVVLVLGLVLVNCGGDTNDADAARAATDAIIQSWIDAWMDEDHTGVTDLYADDGTYADAGCPFGMNGRSAIRNMVMNHLGPTN